MPADECIAATSANTESRMQSTAFHGDTPVASTSTHPDTPVSSTSGLQLLVEAMNTIVNTGPNVSPTIQEALVLPKAKAKKGRVKRLVHSLPDNLTSPEAIRVIALKELAKARKVADLENRAKERYIAKQNKILKNC